MLDTTGYTKGGLAGGASMANVRAGRSMGLTQGVPMGLAGAIMFEFGWSLVRWLALGEAEWWQAAWWFAAFVVAAVVSSGIGSKYDRVTGPLSREEMRTW